MEGVEVGQKGAVSACILLAQALLEKPAVIFKWISFCLLALFFFLLVVLLLSPDLLHLLTWLWKGGF